MRSGTDTSSPSRISSNRDDRHRRCCHRGQCGPPHGSRQVLTLLALTSTPILIPTPTSAPPSTPTPTPTPPPTLTPTTTRTPASVLTPPATPISPPTPPTLPTPSLPWIHPGKVRRYQRSPPCRRRQALRSSRHLPLPNFLLLSPSPQPPPPTPPSPPPSPLPPPLQPPPPPPPLPLSPVAVESKPVVTPLAMAKRILPPKFKPDVSVEQRQTMFAWARGVAVIAVPCWPKGEGFVRDRTRSLFWERVRPWLGGRGWGYGR